MQPQHERQHPMSWVTMAVFAAFAGYVVAWYMEAVEGSFPLFLFLLVIISGAYWLAEWLCFAPARRRAVQTLQETTAQRRADLESLGIQHMEGDNLQETYARLLEPPWWVAWTAGIFPVMAVIFVVRAFAYEPFKIPSGSMIPTLYVGDMILVNKYTYGLRLPIIHTKITAGATPQRGDVMVFRYPPDPRVDYIKRVAGVPGDEVIYLNKKLTINGQPVEATSLPDFFDTGAKRYFRQYEEQLGQHKHRILNTEGVPSYIPTPSDFRFSEQCTYISTSHEGGVTCTVPEGHYFMLGDNRDNSLDSRYWGFVPEENIVGKAFLVWMNFSNLKRIGFIR